MACAECGGRGIVTVKGGGMRCPACSGAEVEAHGEEQLAIERLTREMERGARAIRRHNILADPDEVAQMGMEMRQIRVLCDVLEARLRGHEGG
jgi:hypothetical protein